MKNKMKISVEGFIPPDDTWHKMKAAYDACFSAGVEIPDTVIQFFNYELPSEKGVKIDLSDDTDSVERVSDDTVEIDLKGLPKDVKTLKVVVRS